MSTSLSPLNTSASLSSPITSEHVISPSKMKRSRRSLSVKSPKSPTSPPRIKPSPRDSISPRADSRDDDNDRPSPSPRKKSSKSSGSVSSTPRSSRPPTTPRSNNRSPKQQLALESPKQQKMKQQKSPIGYSKPKQPKSPIDKENNKKIQLTVSTASLSSPPQSRDEDSPRTKLQKKLLSNLRAPDPSLSDLLGVLTDFEQTSHLRRVNACGAIKTLTLHKANQIPLARTKGVVPSITSVLCAVNATEEERTRCINALMHLCVPEENWKLVYLFPQTPEALARNMADKYPQIRYAACLATSFLAKKNRKEVVANRLLMYAMARVLEVDKNGALDRMSVQDKKVFVGARLCVLKMLLHLSKNRDISTTLSRTECVMSALIGVSNAQMELAANILCIAILTNLTRHIENSYYLVYKVPDLVGTFVRHIESNGKDDVECGKCALYALQNLSCTSNCRQELANTPDLLGNVTKAAFRHDCPEQQLSALHTLKNLSDDPFNLVTMTNTPGCTATLLALANNDSSSSDGQEENDKDKQNKEQKDMAQYLACDTLATLSHWLLTLSATRMSKDSVNGEGTTVGGVGSGRIRTFTQCTWEAWN